MPIYPTQTPSSQSNLHFLSFNLQMQENKENSPTIIKESNQEQTDDDVLSKWEKELQEEDDFEFSFACKEPYSSPVPADVVFYKGKIKPIYQMFNKDLFQENNNKDSMTSCSSSDADELENVKPGSYCVWTPKACKKSNSTGTSKRWKFKEILSRSNSDGSRRRSRFDDTKRQDGHDKGKGNKEESCDEEQAILSCRVLCS